MTPEITAFMQMFFTDELVREINRSFGLMDSYDLKNIEAPYVDILMQHQQIHNDQLIDMFTAQVNAHLDYILQEHTLALTPEATIYEKNEFLSALLLIQNLEDYTGIINTLESLAPDEEQLAYIVSHLSQLDETQVMLTVESFNPNILTHLKKFVEQKIEVKSVEVSPIYAQAYKRFCDCFGKDHLGTYLVESGLLLGQPFNLYLNYLVSFIKEQFVDGNVKAFAFNLYSVLILSSDGNKTTMEVFKEHSLELLQDLNKVKAAETELLNLLSIYNERRNAENEKARLS